MFCPARRGQTTATFKLKTNRLLNPKETADWRATIKKAHTAMSGYAQFVTALTRLGISSPALAGLAQAWPRPGKPGLNLRFTAGSQQNKPQADQRQ